MMDAAFARNPKEEPAGKKVVILVSEDWYFLSHRISLARALQGAGYEVVVGCRVIDGREKIESEGFRLCALGIERENTFLLHGWKNLQAMRRLLDREEADVVLNVSLRMVILGTVAAALSRSRRVVNLLTGLGYVFISQKLKARVIRLFIGGVFRCFSKSNSIHTIVQNRDDEQLMKGFGVKQLHIIRGSGVDTEAFSPGEEPRRDQLVTFVGRLLWSKGVGEIVEAARILNKRGRDYRIVLVGEPDPANPQSAKESDLEAWQNEGLVECWGRREDVASIYRRSAIAVLPSWREGLPKSLLEAAACGLPLVATDVPGCREIVEDGQNGFLVPLRDSRALADSIDKLMQNRELRTVMGRRSRAFVEAEFSMEKVNEAMVVLLGRICASDMDAEPSRGDERREG